MIVSSPAEASRQAQYPNLEAQMKGIINYRESPFFIPDSPCPMRTSTVGPFIGPFKNRLLQRCGALDHKGEDKRKMRIFF